MQNGLSANGISRARMVLFSSLSLSLILLAVFALPSISRATRDTGTAKPTKDKSRRPGFVPGEIIVRYRSEKAAQRQPRAAMVQSVAGRSIEIQVDNFRGSNIVEGLRMARVAAPDTMQAIAALKSQPDVLYAEPNYILHKETLPNDPRFPEMYGLKNTGQSGGTAGADIDAEQAWAITTGSRDCVVGVIDEGVDINHPDLNANIWSNPSEIPGNGIDDDLNGFIDDLNGWDFFHDDNSVFDGAADPLNGTDDHGTHVAGTIGAVGNNAIGVVGVNWQVSLMSLKFLGPNGGSSANAIRAISYARNMRDTWVSTNGAQGANVRVLSNSYGGGEFSQAFLDAIKAAGNSGILFVAAAGNNNTNNDLLPYYPSSYDAPNIIAVAATDRFDDLSSFSNFGANTIHVAAPGSSILSTTPNNTYAFRSGTSMATPHVSGGAALLWAANTNLTVQQLKALLIFNGDIDSLLAGKTSTERRLNVGGSLQALVENDVTPPGAVAEFRVTSQSGRSLILAWTAAGDDGPNGQASLYQVSFTDGETGATKVLKSLSPAASGSPQTHNVTIPYQHTNGTITLREFDNAGNEGIPASLAVSVSILDGDPYTTMLGASALSTGGTPLGLAFDEGTRSNYPLPFSFPFFGQNYLLVTISTNGSLYFSSLPSSEFLSSTGSLATSKMIAGLWDDLDLSPGFRADADIYVVQPDPNRIIFRWQGVPCNWGGDFLGCLGGAPINFEIELHSNGSIQTRYGSGNIEVFPVVGISGGEPDPYVITTHTSKDLAIDLTNAQTVTFSPRASMAYSVSGHLADEINNPLSNATITFELDFQGTISTNTTLTDANGNYTFADVACQNSVKITPSKTGYSFNPPSSTLVSPGCVNETATRNFIGIIDSDSTVDPTFGPGANGEIQALALQPDGKILLGGDFTTLGGGGTGTIPRSHLGRLNADGTLDMSFDPGSNGNISALAVQADGKILVGGFISKLGGGGPGTISRKFIGRLNADGTLDSSFDPGADGAVFAIAVQPDGKILVVGNFQKLGGGGSGTTPRKYIGRLNADGTLDPSFHPGANGGAQSVALQTDGKILVAGNFSKLGGGGDGNTTRIGLGRLNSDGTLDTSFDPGPTGQIAGLALQPDGKILLGGSFLELGVSGTPRSHIGRLNADGTVDQTFDPGADGGVASLAVQADGKILAGGYFTTLGGGGSGTTTRHHLGRLNPDGTLDPSFDPGADDTVSGLALQGDGKILVTGIFGSLDTATRNLIGRLYNTEAALQSLNSSFNGTTLKWLRSQASPEVVRVTFELSPDALTYSPLGSGSRIPGGWQLTGLTLPTQQDLYIRARGFYATASRNGSESIVESVTPINIQSSGGPGVSSLSPSNAVAGGAEFILTVHGTEFVADSVIRVNGLDRTTTFVDATQLSTAIAAAEIATAGTFTVTVFNPDPGGGESAPLTFTINNPEPWTVSLQPIGATAGGNGFVVIISGGNFVPGSVVLFNGIARASSFISASQMTTTITAADIALAGSYPITILNPAPGGGTSNPVNLAVFPSVTTISPTTVRAGDPQFTLTVNGVGFVPGTVVRFNGMNRPTSFVSSTELTASIPAADIATVGTYPIVVRTPEFTGSLTSNVVNITAAPSISNLTPITAVAGGPGFTLTIDGCCFVSGTVLRWNGSDRPTTVVNFSRLTAEITAADIQTAGQAEVTISIPGGGITPPTIFVITAPVGYEADVTPRPNGSNNGSVSIADWVQAGRFVAGLDTPAPGNEFQRADCAPRDTLGSGTISISDWVQAGRYASGLDPVMSAGGPTQPIGSPSTSATDISTEFFRPHGPNGNTALPAATRVDLVGTILRHGLSSTVSIEFDAQGNENAFGFSLMFDPAKLRFVSAEKSSEASAATLNVNKLATAKGRIGIALALPGGSTFPSGRHQLVVLTFAMRSDSTELPPISFADLPIAREVVDLNANRLTTVFQSSSEGDPLADSQFFVNQHYLDFLGRIPDGGGLDYWTEQINECGTDRLCINQRRIGVSAAFFVEQEFQHTGSFVYRLYKAGLGRQLSYAEFAADRGQVIGSANLNQSKSVFADSFVERAEFVQKYQQHQTAETFIDHLLHQLRESSQVDLSLRRGELITLYQTGRTGNQSRSQVLQMVIEDLSYKQAEYNPSFVLMEYFGYLRRDPDKEGYDFWLNVLNNRDPGNYRGMVCSFITSTEYQRRFSQIVSQSNADCSQ